MTTQHLYLDSRRLPRWWETFTREHPQMTARVAEGALVLTSTDGTIARFTGWHPVHDVEGALEQLLARPDQVGIVLLRRGGYAIGHLSGQELIAHKTGTRYVQGRTAAGGWSQQRFARRRANQANELLAAAGEHAGRILAPLVRRPDGAGLAVGGDDRLINQLLAGPWLRPLTAVPRRVFPGVREPRHKVLTEIARRCSEVSVAVDNPPH